MTALRSDRAVDVGLPLLLGVAQAVALVVFAPTLADMLLPLPLAVHGVLLVALVAVTTVRRRAPVPVAAVVAAASLLTPTWSTVLAAWALGAYTPEGSRHRGETVALVALVVLPYVGAATWRARLSFGDQLGVTALTVALWALGRYVGTRRRLLAEAQARVAESERARLLAEQQARAEERVRVAAGMHDVLAAQVSLVVLQAGALGVRAPDASTRAAAEELRGTGMRALDELRELVGLLSAEPPGPAGPGEPVDVAADLAALVAEQVRAGRTVALDGTPPPLRPTVARALLGVVRESLTNAAKHAPGAPVTVRVTRAADAVSVRVTSTPGDPDGDPAAADLARSGAGLGLTALAQRVDLVGGRFSAGRDDGGDFAVTAELPVPPS